MIEYLIGFGAGFAFCAYWMLWHYEHSERGDTES